MLPPVLANGLCDALLRDAAGGPALVHRLPQFIRQSPRFNLQQRAMRRREILILQFVDLRVQQWPRARRSFGSISVGVLMPGKLLHRRIRRKCAPVTAPRVRAAQLSARVSCRPPGLIRRGRGFRWLTPPRRMGRAADGGRASRLISMVPPGRSNSAGLAPLSITPTAKQLRFRPCPVIQLGDTAARGKIP